MSGGNMMGPGGNRAEMLGQQLPGGMTREDLQNRQSLELDLVLSQHVHQLTVMSADLVLTCSTNPAFQKMPNREKYGQMAVALQSDFIHMEVIVMESIRKKLKKCRPLSENNGLKLCDIRAAGDVLVDLAEQSDEKT